jgi:hypothetical protein
MSLSDFYVNRKKYNKKEEFNQLIQMPHHDTGVDVPHIYNNIKGDDFVQQADLLFLPTDKFGYRYILVVVDVSSRLCDAEPIKNKTAQAVLTAFKKIYERKIINLPIRIKCDSGTEFKGITKEYFEDNNVHILYGLPNRHRQQSLVEKKNAEIGGIISQFQAKKELKTKKVVKAGWVEGLPDLITKINEHSSKLIKNQKKPIDFDNGPILYTKYSQDLLLLHQHVRKILDYPISAGIDTRQHGGFRKGDIRFSKEKYEIEKIILNPNLPVMYQVNKLGTHDIDTRVAYTKSQLIPFV